MTDAKTVDVDPQAQPQPAVELRVLADADQLPVLRALAATIALHEDFDLDEVADIRLAMDEVCTRLINHATAGAELVCRLQYTAPALQVSVSTTTRTTETAAARSFGWHVLEALTDSVSMHAERTARGSVSTIVFTKVSATAALP